MHLVLMVIVLVAGGALRFSARPYPDVAACEAGKASVQAQAIAGGLDHFGLVCTPVIEIGSPS